MSELASDASGSAGDLTPKPGDGPDVTVVVAVYNTMPYLTECLNSLVRQTIGADRMQVEVVPESGAAAAPGARPPAGARP